MLTPAAGMRRAPGGAPFAPGAAVVAPALALVALAALAGCAGRRAIPPAVPPAPRPAPGYVALVDSLGSVDGSVLAGRRIALDPGHGGAFRGSLGVNGTAEAVVNLGVALRLRDLLEAHGAQVLLTRGTDRDFLTPADSSLRSDLAERARLANAFRPDLFVSIHHNADPGGRHDVNETQTYYKLGDDGPSYDAGADVHRALVRNLGIATNRLVPGNFFVLRAVDAPALLTEASYVTNPDVEAKLATPAAQELEAEALYLGIARYFARKVPVIDTLWVAERPDTPAGAGGRARDGRPEIGARVRGAFDAVAVRVDGNEVAAQVADGRVRARPGAPLAIGWHEASVSARLAGEGSARTRRDSFEVLKPGGPRLEAAIPVADARPSRDAIPLRVRAFDPDRLPWPETTLVALHVETPRALVPRDTTVRIADGVAWAYFRSADPARAAGRARIALRVAGGPGPAGAPVVFGTDVPLGPLDVAGERTGFAREMPFDRPLRDAPGTSGFEPPLAWLNRDGFVALRADAGGVFRSPRLAGFRAWGADTTWPPRYVAVAGGALANRRIVLDPEGGGDDPAGTGPSGVRASALNLELARALAAMLAAAGASVRLTRTSEAAVSEVERVQVSEAFGAERYLRLGHASAPPSAGHYFSSAGGRRLAQRVADAAAQLGLADTLAVGESAKYPIAQVSAVAVSVSLARLDDARGEALAVAPGRLRTEALALYLALARDFGAATGTTPDTLEVRDAEGRPVPGALVTLGGTLVLQADADGRVRFVRTEDGPLEAACEDSRVDARTLLLDSVRTHVLSGTR